MSADRTDIYYWKCDRAAAFHGTSDYLRDQSALQAMLAEELEPSPRQGRCGMRRQVK